MWHARSHELLLFLCSLAAVHPALETLYASYYVHRSYVDLSVDSVGIIIL